MFTDPLLDVLCLMPVQKLVQTSQSHGVLALTIFSLDILAVYPLLGCAKSSSYWCCSSQ